MPRIETWFPESIYIEENFSLDLIPEIKKTILEKTELTRRSDSFNIESTHLENRNIHLQPKFSVLANRIEEHCKVYAKMLGYNTESIDSLFLCSMWYNISYKTDFLFPHNHAGAVISGVFYVDSSEIDKIIFYNDLNKFTSMPENTNELSHLQATYPCITGTLYLWRGNFMHGNPKQHGDQKIAISFNTAIERVKGNSY